MLFCTVLEALVGSAGEDRSPGLAADAGGDDARAGERGVEASSESSRRRSASAVRSTTSSALAPRWRAAIAL